MAKLHYAAIASLDGFTADEDGRFDWAEPDEAVHAFVNDLERPIGTYLYGRRMYETLAVWETEPAFAEHSDVTRDYAAVWQDADKIVFSRTLAQPVTRRTRIERELAPELVRELKASATRDLAIGGPTLAGEAIRAGLVDEVHLFLAPVIVGGGTRALPDGVRLSLELADERRFESGFVYLRYRVR